MTKDEFITLINKRLPEQSEVHNRTIELSVASIFNDIIFKRFKKGEIDQFALPYENNEIKQDSNDNFYCDLPINLIPSPSVFGNVRRIYPSDEDDIFFVMIHPNRVRLIKHDDLFKTMAAIPYYLKGKTAQFPVKNMVGITHVDMNIIPAITDYGWEDHIMMPGGSELSIIKEIASLFVDTPPKDKVND